MKGTSNICLWIWFLLYYLKSEINAQVSIGLLYYCKIGEGEIRIWLNKFSLDIFSLPSSATYAGLNSALTLQAAPLQSSSLFSLFLSSP